MSKVCGQGQGNGLVKKNDIMIGVLPVGGESNERKTLILFFPSLPLFCSSILCPSSPSFRGEGRDETDEQRSLAAGFSMI